MRRIIPLEEKFESRYVKLKSGCWKWIGNIDPGTGYGRLTHGRRGSETRFLAHRLAYTLYRGRISKQRQIDHLCRHRWCVNPWHMEVVTRKINLLRGNSFSGINHRKEYCNRGHKLSGDNVRMYQGKRRCRACAREDYHNRKARV